MHTSKFCTFDPHNDNVQTILCRIYELSASKPSHKHSSFKLNNIKHHQNNQATNFYYSTLATKQYIYCHSIESPPLYL